MEYNKLFENLPWPIWIEDEMQKVTYINKKYESTFKFELSQVIGKTNKEIFTSKLNEFYNEKVKNTLLKEDCTIIKGIISNTAEKCYIIPIRDENKKIQCIVGIIVDISENIEKEKKKQNKLNILETIMNALPDSIFYKDKNSKLIEYNKSFEEFYKKLGIQDVVGKNDLEIYHNKEIATEFMRLDNEIMNDKEIRHYEQEIEDVNGDKIIVENVKIPILDSNGESTGIVGISRNITNRKIFEERLRYLSEIDILTGLYNRYSFEEKIRSLNNEKHLPLGIIMGDLNGLKLVNDTLGHLEGDKLLINTAKVLKKINIDDKYIFRWGGDEFIILIPNIDETECENIIDKINKDCREIKHDFIQLNIALSASIKYMVDEDIYECIKKAEKKVYLKKLLEKKSIKSSIITSLKKTLEEKSLETTEHTNRVTAVSKAIGKMMSLKKSELDELELASELHDIGKIGISEEILMKPDKLTDEEFEIIKTHAEKGYRIINAASDMGNVAKYILTHHENWDGTGYPLGLKGEQIPLIARIVSVADAFDVMTNDRPYKKGLSKEEAITELEKCKGTQFDPKIVECIKKYIEFESKQ